MGMQSSNLSLPLVIEKPGDDIARPECSFCKILFKPGDERINTCTMTENVSLCRTCYDTAGNNVR